METADNFLESVIYQLESYKRMAEKAIDQISDEQLRWQKDSNLSNWLCAPTAR